MLHVYLSLLFSEAGDCHCKSAIRVAVNSCKTTIGVANTCLDDAKATLGLANTCLDNAKATIGVATTCLDKAKKQQLVWQPIVPIKPNKISNWKAPNCSADSPQLATPLVVILKLTPGNEMGMFTDAVNVSHD